MESSFSMMTVLLKAAVAPGHSVWTLFLHPPIERSGLPRCYPWSLPAESVQGLEHHEAIVQPLVLPPWHHLHELTRIHKSVGVFPLSMQVSVRTQVSSLLDVLLIHTALILWFSLGTFRLISLQLFPTGVELHCLCVKPSTSGWERLSVRLRLLSQTSSPQRNSWPQMDSFFFVCFFYLTGIKTGRLVPQWKNTGTVNTRVQLALVTEGRPLCSGSRRQTVDCTSSLQPLPSSLQRLLMATTGFVFVAMSVKRCYSGFMFLEKHLRLSLQESLYYFCSFFFLNQSN